MCNILVAVDRTVMVGMFMWLHGITDGHKFTLGRVYNGYTTLHDIIQHHK